jgi:hypothetical protein
VQEPEIIFIYFKFFINKNVKGQYRENNLRIKVNHTFITDFLSTYTVFTNNKRVTEENYFSQYKAVFPNLRNVLFQCILYRTCTLIILFFREINEENL